MIGKPILSILLFALPVLAADIAVNGMVYSNVSVISNRCDLYSIVVMHKGGITRVEYKDMSEADKLRYGYNEDLQKKAEQKKAVEVQSRAEQAKHKAEVENKESQAKQEVEKKIEETEKKKGIRIEEEQQRRNNVIKSTSKMSIAEFKASKPTNSVLFECVATLVDHFQYEYRNKKDSEFQNQWWSIEMSIPLGFDYLMRHPYDKPERFGYGYIRRDTDDGKRLFDIVKDGNPHFMQFFVAFNPNAKSSDHFNIVYFISKYNNGIFSIIKYFIRSC